MWNFTRTRYTAGNICLVLFTAFLFTILVSPMAMVGSAEAALVGTGNDTVTAYESDVTSESYEFLVQLAVSDPLTSFDNIRIDFTDDNGEIISVYGDDMANSYVPDEVYGAVYSLVYDVPEDFAVPDNNQVYGKVYVDEEFLYEFVMTLPNPPDEGSGGSGGSSTPETPSQPGTVEKPASDLVGSSAKEISVKNGDVSFQVPAGLLNVPALTELFTADANTKVDFIVKEVTAASVGLADKMGRSEFANLKAVGKVYDFSILARSGDKEVKINKFNGKMRVAIPYSLADLGGLKENTLGAFRVTDNGLVSLGGDVDPATKQVWFETDSFSNYTLMAKVVAFADIMNHWAKGDIEVLAENGIVKGINSNLFAPDANVTRAEFATMLVKALGLSVVNPASETFQDVKSGAWYYSMVETAYANGLVAGYNGNFNPNGKITRMEMAAMIAKALKAGGKTVGLSESEIAQTLNKFSDNGQIADWAKESVAVAVKEGIITGRTASTFVGQANATRAEGVVMIKKDLQVLGKL